MIDRQAKWGFILVGLASAIALHSIVGPEPAAAPTAKASTTEVKIGETGYLREADGGGVWVFKSRDSLSKARALARAGADSSLILQELACSTPTNTKVLVITGEISSAFLSGMDGTADVVVVAGPKAGCKGTVAKNKIVSAPAS
jgi:hypothetical protein